MDREFFAQSELKERGWTDTAIRRFAGEPDETRRNPHYRCAAPMKFFKAVRIIELEATPDFLAWLAKSEKRKASAKIGAEKAVETKRRRTIEYVEDAEVKIPSISYDELVRRACESYNDAVRFDWNREHLWEATADSDPLFLRRICVNFLRHECTEYDDTLWKIQSRVGVDDAVIALRKRIFIAIARAFPELKKECLKQANDRGVQLRRDEISPINDSMKTADNPMHITMVGQHGRLE